MRIRLLGLCLRDLQGLLAIQLLLLLATVLLTPADAADVRVHLAWLLFLVPGWWLSACWTGRRASVAQQYAHAVITSVAVHGCLAGLVAWTGWGFSVYFLCFGLVFASAGAWRFRQLSQFRRGAAIRCRLGTTAARCRADAVGGCGLPGTEVERHRAVFAAATGHDRASIDAAERDRDDGVGSLRSDAAMEGATVALVALPGGRCNIASRHRRLVPLGSHSDCLCGAGQSVAHDSSARWRAVTALWRSPWPCWDRL